jgi:alpha-1,3/alpha-1,6-mannosyltransferase
MADKKQHVVFFHPDLGIGGAERLVIDAAVGLQNRGHKVTIFTSYCDPNHCFDEARDGKPLLHTVDHPPLMYGQAAKT